MHKIRGFTLLEVLITLVVLAIGMLGLASLQSKVHTTELESYQRAQAVLLLQDMVDRINANRTQANNYVTAAGKVLGVGSDISTVEKLADCATATGVARDQCEWSVALKGAAERRTVGGNESSVGAMIGARGCVERLQAQNATPGVCTPGIYRVTVAWQGVAPTVAPSLACASGLYDSDSMRRVITATVTIGLPTCPPS